MIDNSIGVRFAGKAAGCMAGEKTRIVFLGGSVTKGSFSDEHCNYVNIFEEKLNKMAGSGLQCDVINLGEPAANSLNGRISVERDIVDIRPDMVFLDYSVNDSSQIWQAEAFEGIVRRILSMEQAPAVCPVIFCNHARQSTGGMISWVARHYGIPVIDIAGELCRAIDSGKMTWEDYACDYVHPNLQGYQMIADRLLSFLNSWSMQTGRPDMADVIPDSSCFSGMYNEFKLLQHQYDILQHSSEKRGSVIYKNKFGFRALVIEHIQDSVWNEASLSVEVDGECVRLLDAFSSGAWGNAVACPVYRSEESGEHSVVLRVNHEPTIDDWSFDDFITAIGMS